MNSGTKMLIFVILGLLAVLGCSNQSAKVTGDDEGVVVSTPLPKPPSLVVTVGEKEIKPIRGAYYWKIEHRDGTEESIVEADSFLPSGIPEFEEPVKVNGDAEVTFTFGEEPSGYQIREWEPGSERTIVGTYDEIDLAEFEGETILEVTSSWEAGAAGYILYLDVERESD
ncbi:hypothetical protein [Alteribacter keqinensis]|nr:hypothetical protein [Alteribacter keqinensis]